MKASTSKTASGFASGIAPLFATLVASLVAPALAFLTALPATVSAAEVVVYSSRNEHLVKPVFEAYMKETGVKVSWRTDKDAALLQRVKAEGRNSRADLILTVDAGNLWQAAQMELLQPVNSEVLQKNVPAHLRDPQNRWFGLSVRARTVVYNTAKAKPADFPTYESLAAPELKGKLCLRSSKKVYNQSLVAMLLAQHGEEKTGGIVQGWVANLAAPPFGDDTQVLKAVASGQCAVGVVNTYYYGRLMKNEPGLPLAIHWPNQKDSGGVHINVSGAGLARHARNKAEAVKLLEWLSSEKAQNLFADENMEYPVNPAVKPHAQVAAWGEFKPSTMNLSKAGELQSDAIRLMDRAGYK